MVNLFCLAVSIRRVDGGLHVRRYELVNRFQCGTPCFDKLFPRVTGPQDARYQKRAHNSDQNLLRSVEADLPRLCWIRDPIGSDGKRGETEQIISIWDLACSELAVLVAGKSNDQEKDGQKDRWCRSIVADQPDANDSSCDRSDYSHDCFERNRTHESCAHQHDNAKYRPVIMGQSQHLTAKQREQTRQTHFDPISYS